MAKNAKKSRNLNCEMLERREVFSGFVSAHIEGGSLVIQGDSQENEIVIYRGAKAGQVTVAGANIDGVPAGRTQVNGKFAPVTLNGFNGGIRGDLREGSDKLIVTNLEVASNVVLHGGKGGDQIALSGNNPFVGAFLPLNDTGASAPTGALRVHGSVTLNTEEGQDFGGLIDTVVDHDVIFNGGAGNDFFQAFGTQTNVPTTLISGSLVFNPGAGDDVSQVSQIKVGRNIDVNDTDAISSSTVNFFSFTANADVHITTSPYADFVSIVGRASNLYIHTGAGTDNVGLNVINALDVVIDTGADTDSLFLGGDGSHTLRRVTLIAGTGNDNVEISTLRVVNATVLLGEGNDRLSVSDVTVTETAEFDGGPGTNQLLLNGGNKYKRLIRRNI